MARGPDNQAIIQMKNLQRVELSILDLSKLGNQPIHSEQADEYGFQW